MRVVKFTLVLENVHLEQTVVNGSDSFCIFTRNSFILNVFVFSFVFLDLVNWDSEHLACSFVTLALASTENLRLTRPHPQLSDL